MINYSPQPNTEFDNIVDILSYRATVQAHQTAYTFLVGSEGEEDRLTYQELDTLARSIAIKLQSLSAKGDRALLLYPPGLDFIAAFYGCLYAGIIAVPAYPPRTNRSLSPLRTLVHDARPTVVLTTNEISANIKDHFNHMHWLTTDNIRKAGWIHDRVKFWQKPKITGDMLAFLQYTSGSTATPKGVMVSHGNMFNNSALISKHCHDRENGRIVTWLPFQHDMGLSGGVVQPLYAGIPVFIMSPIEFLKKPCQWLEAVTRFKATFSGGPNFAYELCINKITPQQREHLDLSCWKVAINGAEPVRSETIERFTKIFAGAGFRRKTFYPCYGLAEATIFVSGGSASNEPVVTSVSSDDIKENRFKEKEVDEQTQQLVGCGNKLTGHKIKIVDPGSFRELGEGNIGEIWVSGPSVTLGYWNKQAETKHTFQARIKDPEDDDGYLRTGDMGAFYKGELFVTGRLKDMIIIRGQNHYPQDIEATVRNSHPLLTNGMCAAFSIEKNLKEKLVVVQEIKEFNQNGHGVNEVKGDIQQALMETHGLQLYKAVFVKRGKIPMTSSGKIKRRACCQLFLDNKLEEYTQEKVTLNQVPREGAQGGKNEAAELHIHRQDKRRDPTVVGGSYCEGTGH